MVYVEGDFFTLGKGGHRGGDGFLLGGVTSLKIATQYPKHFRSAGSYDGTFFYATRSGKSIKAEDRVFSAPLFNPHFGVPRDYHYGAANNPANLIIQGDKEELSRLCWMVQ